MTLEIILITVLRIFGSLWMVGGFFVIKNARLSLMVDKAIAQIDNSLDDEFDEFNATDDDPGRERWLLVGGVLTFVCGAALVAASYLAVIALTAMVIHQTLYMLRQRRRVKTATSEIVAEEATINQTTRNGAITAVIIWVIALILYRDHIHIWSTTLLTWL